MAERKSSVDKTIGLTIFTVIGKLKDGELHSYFEDYFQGERANMVLWDIINGEMSGLTVEGIRSDVLKGRHLTRKGDRTAFVFSRDVDFGIGRILHAYSNFEGSVASIKIFRDINEAKNWLMESLPDHRL